MADKKKPKPAATGDRHKPSRMIRIPELMAVLLEECAREEIGSSLTEQVKIAIREYLQRRGKGSTAQK